MLAASVSINGGFGFIAAGYGGIEETFKDIDEAALVVQKSGQAITDTVPIGVGFFTWALEKKPLNEVEDTFHKIFHRTPHPIAIWIGFGNNAEYIKLIRKVSPSTKVFVQLHSVKEALEHAALGVDVISAQGVDAGGHGSAINVAGTTVLVEEMVAALAKNKFSTLVLGAGGITSGKALVANLAVGADGVAIGTRLTTAKESKLAQAKKDAIFATSDAGVTTLRSTVFDRIRGTNQWPEQYDGRGIRNAMTKETREGQVNDDDDIFKRNKELFSKGDIDRQVIWSGTGAGLISSQQSVKDIMQDIASDATATITRLQTY